MSIYAQYEADFWLGYLQTCYTYLAFFAAVVALYEVVESREVNPVMVLDFPSQLEFGNLPSKSTTVTISIGNLGQLAIRPGEASLCILLPRTLFPTPPKVMAMHNGVVASSDEKVGFLEHDEDYFYTSLDIQRIVFPQRARSLLTIEMPNPAPGVYQFKYFIPTVTGIYPKSVRASLDGSAYENLPVLDLVVSIKEKHP
jgi:hypothetical protein